MKRLVKFIKWVNLLLIFLTILSYLSTFIDPGIFWPPAILGLIYPILLACNLFFIVFWIFLKKPFFLYSVICILLGWSHLTGFIGLRFSPEEAPEESLSIMSFNCHSWLDANLKIIDHTKELNTIYKENPDILCLQEFPRMWESGQHYIREITENTSLKYHFRSSNGRLVILSSYPLEKKREKNFSPDNPTNGYQYLDIKTDSQTLRLFNLHMQSNTITIMADKVASEGNINEKETWQNVKGIIKRYIRTSKIRAVQAKEIAEHIRRSPWPVIVCGDFNETPQSFAYRTLALPLNDLFRLKGQGLGTTYSGSIPALRIDYILVSKEFKALHYKTIKTSFSDHYAVSGKISLNSN